MEFSGSIKFSPDECVAVHTAMKLLRPSGGAFFRGMVDGLSPTDMLYCLFRAIPPCWKPYEQKDPVHRWHATRWCYHKGIAFAFMMSDMSHYLSDERVFPYAVFLFVGINKTATGKLPNLDRLPRL